MIWLQIPCFSLFFLNYISADPTKASCTSPGLANNWVVFSAGSPLGVQAAFLQCMQRTWTLPLFPGPGGHKCTPCRRESRIRTSTDIAGAPAFPKFPFPLFWKAVKALEELMSHYKLLNSHSGGQKSHRLMCRCGFQGLAKRKPTELWSHSTTLTNVPGTRPAVGVLCTLVGFIPWHSLALLSFTHLVLFTH